MARSTFRCDISGRTNTDTRDSAHSGYWVSSSVYPHPGPPRFRIECYPKDSRSVDGKATLSSGCVVLRSNLAEPELWSSTMPPSVESNLVRVRPRTYRTTHLSASALIKFHNPGRLDGVPQSTHLHDLQDHESRGAAETSPPIQDPPAPGMMEGPIRPLLKSGSMP